MTGKEARAYVGSHSKSCPGCGAQFMFCYGGSDPQLIAAADLITAAVRDGRIQIFASEDAEEDLRNRTAFSFTSRVKQP